MTSCPENQNISEFNYEKLRENNLNKIKEYYQSVLNEYTNKYGEYSKKLANGTDEQKENANFMMVENEDVKIINTHLIDIKKKLNEIVKTDTSNILVQKEKNELEKEEIKKNREKINNLKLIVNKNEKITETNSDTLHDNTTHNYNINYNQYILIIVNVILFVIMLILVYYLVFNTTTITKSKNNNNIIFNNI